MYNIVMNPNKNLQKLKKTLNKNLRQGISPEKLTVSLLLGIMLGLFPLIGITSFMCFLASMSFRLNHVFIQLVNYLVYPIQLLIIIPFLRLGHKLFPFSQIQEVSPSIIQTFSGSDIQFIMGEFSLLLLSAIILWILIALPLAGVLYPIIVKQIRKTQTKFKI